MITAKSATIEDEKLMGYPFCQYKHKLKTKKHPRNAELNMEEDVSVKPLSIYQINFIIFQR